MGKLKIAIAAVVVIALAGFVVVQQQTIKELRQETETLKQQAAQVAPLQEQLDRATQDAANAGGSTESQKHDLVKLRAEVSKLRTQSGQLAKAQQEIESLHQRLESAADAGRDQTAALQAELQKSQAANQSVQAMNTCINNLRLIDSAKQQWALEYKKGAADIPTWDDLRPYLTGPNNTNMPFCPAAGVYTMGNVSEKPTCSIPGHVLP
jgi:predicted RNase H-like nuclease (RuvC/YqgF family)